MTRQSCTISFEGRNEARNKEGTGRKERNERRKSLGLAAPRDVDNFMLAVLVGGSMSPTEQELLCWGPSTRAYMHLPRERASFTFKSKVRGPAFRFLF